MKTQKIDLCTGGFHIRIILNPTQEREIHDSWINKSLSEDILKHYSAFLSNKRLSKIDFTIYLFQHFPSIFTRKSKDSHLGLLHFYKLHKNKILSFQHLSINQFNIILLTVLQTLASRTGGFLLHTSASITNNRLYLFCAKSGGGKSTAMKLLHPHFQAFSDDILIVRKIRNKYYGFQSPVREKNDWIIKTQRHYPIGGIFFLHKAKFYRLTKIEDTSKIITLLSSQLLTYDPHTIPPIKNAFIFVQRFNHYYSLSFNKGNTLVIYIEKRVKN